MNNNYRIITVYDLNTDSLPDSPIPDSAFAPSSQATGARHQLIGALHIAETPMHLSLGENGECCYLGKRIDLFPECVLEFITAILRLYPLIEIFNGR
jgi:hypothetical protein